MAFELLGKLKKQVLGQDTEIVISYPFSVELELFRKLYITRIYKRILTDCLYRSAGIDKENDAMFFDNFLSRELPQGFISFIAEAMYYRKPKIYLTYKDKVFAQASQKEIDEIEADIKNHKTLTNAAICDFSKFELTELLKGYCEIIFNAIHSANTGMKMSEAVILKISNYRGSISLAAQDSAKEQAEISVKSIKNKGGAIMDAADSIDMPKYDIAPTEKSFQFGNALIANAVGVSSAYIDGALTSGAINNTGEADDLAIERGISYFFYSIFKPLYESLSGDSITFKSNNWRKMQTLTGVLAAIENSELIETERKKEFIAELLN